LILCLIFWHPRTLQTLTTTMAHRGAADEWDSLSRNPQHHHIPTAPPNASVQPQLTQNPPNSSNPQPPRKAKRHRRRYVPVGPAGVWFQTQQSSLPRNNKGDEEDEEVVLNSPRNTRPSNNGIAFYSPAWMSMQCEIGFLTPSLPAYLSEQERYTLLRPHVPNHHLMIPELLQGKADWKLPPNKSLFVLVHTIQALSDNLWTVELTDETGFKISAWIQPKLVSQEEQRSTPHYIRPGLVWMLQNVTILLVAKQVPDEGAERVSKMDRILLVSEANIKKLWTPSEEAVSDQDYIQWMERRNTLTSQVMEDRQMHHSINVDEEGSEEEGHIASDEEEDGDTPSRPPSPPQTRPNAGSSIAFQSPRSFTTAQQQTLSQAASTGPNMRQSSQSSLNSFSGISNAPEVPVLSQTVSKAGRTEQRSHRAATTSAVPSIRATSNPPVANVYRKPLRPPNVPDTNLQQTKSPVFSQRDQSPKQPPSATDHSSFAEGFFLPEESQTRVSSSEQSRLRGSAKCSNSCRVRTSPQSSRARGGSPLPSGRSSNDTSTEERHTPGPVTKAQTNRSTERVKHDFQQFAAAAVDFMSQQSPLPSQNTNQTPESTELSPKPSQQKENAQPKRSSGNHKSSTTKKKRRKATTSPKTPSKLWAMNDTEMLEMFDEDSDDDLATAVKSANKPDKQPTRGGSTTQAEEKSTDDGESAEPKSSLFQVSAFEGVDMDELFDDDE